MLTARSRSIADGIRAPIASQSVELTLGSNTVAPRMDHLRDLAPNLECKHSGG
jgi:hypothetical protein